MPPNENQEKLSLTYWLLDRSKQIVPTMGIICSMAHNHIETDVKHRLWNWGLDIRGLRSLGGFKIQCLSELASAIKDNVFVTKIKIHKRKELQIEGITYMGQNIAKQISGLHYSFSCFLSTLWLFRYKNHFIEKSFYDCSVT